jgi:hypothetical protein
MRLRSAARQRLRESLVSSIAQFPHQTLPKVLECVIPSEGKVVRLLLDPEPQGIHSRARKFVL